MCVLFITRLLRGVGRWARKPVNHTSWVAVVTPTDRTKSARNRCVIELFVALFVLSLCPFDTSVGVWASVIGLSQIASFLSLPSIYDLHENPVQKSKWRETVKSVVSERWRSENFLIQKEGVEKSSLKYMNFEDFKVGKPHHIWECASLYTLQVKESRGEGKSSSRNVQVAAGSVKISRGICKFNVQDLSFSCNIIILECTSLVARRQFLGHFFKSWKRRRFSSESTDTGCVNSYWTQITPNCLYVCRDRKQFKESKQ